MPFVPVPNVVQANIRGTYLGERVENTLYFAHGVPWTPLQLETAAAEIGAWWRSTVMGVLSDGYTYRETYVVDLTTVTSGTATDTVASGLAGSATGDECPGNVALCVSFRTANRGRSFRGRNYICGLPEAAVTGNFISGGFIAPVVNAYLLLATPGEMVDGVWVVVSRYANNLRRTVGVATPVTNVLVVDNVVDSQRRRLPGRGA